MLLIYDITDLNSFLNLNEWLAKIRDYCDEHAKVALIGNKKDLCEKLDRSLLNSLINDDNDKGDNTIESWKNVI